MTGRERKLAVLLGGLVLILGVGFGGYAGVYAPLSDNWQAAARLENDIAEKEAKLAQIRKDIPRLQATIKRSLPADPELAGSEYSAVINRLLQKARVPASAYSIRSKQLDNRGAPEVAPKKPAYTKLGLEVTLKPVSLSTLIDVLYRYYRLNLLQQITRFTVKKVEGGNPRRTSSVVSDRADLDVTFVTEAIILDGAENRRTLLALPPGIGAVGGGLPYAVPEPARDLNPQQFAPVLSTSDRDYTLMLVKDVFHGPPPLRPPPPVLAKEDTSPFIRLTGVGRNPDGTGTATIEDIAGRQLYEIELKREGGRLVAEVVKCYFTRKGVKKSYEKDTVLDISEATSATARKFRVIGLDGDALLLADLGGADKAAEEAPKPVSVRKGPPRLYAAAPPPATAVVGAVAAATAPPSAPPEMVLVWRHGEALNKVKALPPEEGQRAIERATGVPAGVPTTPTPTVPVTSPPGAAAWAVTSPVAR
jgi:hypothetical protein